MNALNTSFNFYKPFQMEDVSCVNKESDRKDITVE